MMNPLLLLHTVITKAATADKNLVHFELTAICFTIFRHLILKQSFYLVDGKKYFFPLTNQHGFAHKERMKKAKTSVENSSPVLDSIIEAAFLLFADLGFEATTTNKIAARAGVSIGSLYRYFPNKENLLEHLTKQFTDRNRAVFLEQLRLGAPLPLEKNLQNMVIFSAHYFVKQGGFLTVLMVKMYEVGLTNEIFNARRKLASEYAKLIIEFYPLEVSGTITELENRLYYAIHGYMSVLLVLIEAGKKEDQIKIIQNTMRDLFVTAIRNA